MRDIKSLLNDRLFFLYETTTNNNFCITFVPLISKSQWVLYIVDSLELKISYKMKRRMNIKSKRIQDAVNRFLNKDLRNRQAYMRVVDSEGRIKESVCFRVEDDGNILAVFPNTYGNADRSRDTMVCADSKGKHSVCTYDYVSEYTKAADSTQYESLLGKLTDSIGYNLTIMNTMPTKTELASVRDNAIKAYREARKAQIMAIEDARMLNRGDEIEYKGKRGKIQYALFHGQEPVIIRWNSEEGSEEFEVPYSEVSKLKVGDSKKSKVKDADEETDADADVDTSGNDNDLEGDEVKDNCGGKKKTKDSVVKIVKRKTKKAE